MKFLERSADNPPQGHLGPWVVLAVAAIAWTGPMVIVSSIASAAPLAMQGNPFAGETDAGPAAGSATTNALPGVGDQRFQLTDENARSQIGLVVRAVRMSDPQTPDQLLDAVETLLDADAVGDARFYLDQLANQNLAPQQLFELYQDRGPEFFYQLHATDELAPAGRTLAKNVLAAAKSYAKSPQRIDALVRQLSDADIDVRSSALSQLKRIGQPAYAAMLEVFADPSRENEFSGIRGAVQRLGDDATDVLIAAARSANPQLQTESYVALTKLRSKAASELIGYLYLSPKTPESVKNLAAQKLTQIYGQIDNQRLYRNLQAGAQASLKVIETGFDSQATVVSWTFDDAKKTFQRRKIPTILAAKHAAAFQAELLYEIDPDSDFNRELFLLTQIDAAKRAAGPDSLVDAKALLEKFDDPSPNELDGLLKRAIELKLMPAAIGICELIRQQANALSLQTGSRSQLIEAILYGDRHLQFAAFEAVVAIDPQTAFPGSSHVLEMAAFFAKSEGVEKALIGHLLGPSSRSYSSVVAATGLSVWSARNGREFYNQAVASPDFEVFIVTPSLAKPAARELIQLLRRDWRTRQVPIAFIATDDRELNSLTVLAQSDPLLRPLRLSFDSRVVASQVAEIKSLSSSWPVSAANRLLHGQVAINWMLKMIDQQQSHRFYQLQRHQDAIYGLLAVNGYTEKACQMIAKMGTPKAQVALADFASQSGYSLGQRQTAAECFSAAIKNFGTLLTTEQIQRQYDRYNASESQSPEIQKLMGTMIDAIERRSADTNQ